MSNYQTINRFSACVSDVNSNDDHNESRAVLKLWDTFIDEELFNDFLDFFYPDARNSFDLSRGFEFIDKKEVEQLFPEENQDLPRHLDKLVKVYSRLNGGEWIIMHISIQAYPDQDFAERMANYHCLIKDKYGKPVTAIAILTDFDENFHPKHYEYSFMGTTLRYDFRTYKVLEQDEDKLRVM